MNTILDTFGLKSIVDSSYINPPTLISLFLLLIIASFIDFKTHKIPNKLNLSFLILRILLIPFLGLKLGNVFGAIAGSLFVLIPAMIKMKPMGGDIKLMGVVGFYLGFQNTLILMIFAVLFSAIYYGIMLLLKKEIKDVPFAPFILMGLIVLSLLKFAV